MKPLMFFESAIPEKLGELFSDSKWDAVTLPPAGIFFRQKASKVPDRLFKHEFKHWYQFEELQKNNAGALYYPVFLASYVVLGYDKSRLEIQARDYEKKPLTAVEKLWVELARKTHA